MHRHFSSCGEQGLRSGCGAQASHCSDFSCCGAQPLGHVGFSSYCIQLSSCSSRVLEHGLSNCGSMGLLLLSIWSLPQLQLEPVSPALVDGFLTTVSSEKSLFEVLLVELFVCPIVPLQEVLSAFPSSIFLCLGWGKH